MTRDGAASIATPRLRGKVAIVTGGTSGIGRATCVALARAEAHVAIVGRDPERLEQARSLIGDTYCGSTGQAITYRGDVRSESDMRDMAATVYDRYGALDILVCSAGVLRARGAGLRMVADLPLQEWDEVLSVNLSGTFFSIQAVLPYMMRQRGGDIINISSKSGQKGIAFDAPYCASKFAVLGLTQVLAEEVKQYDIRVQAVLPGPFQSAVWEQNWPLPSPGQLPPAERVAQLIVWMLSMPGDTRLAEVVVDPLTTVAGSGWHGEKTNLQENTT